jgi:pyruvate kinase
MADLKGAKAAPDGAGVNLVNVISMEMADLSEKDRNDLELELQQELEEVMAKKRRHKLSCF